MQKNPKLLSALTSLFFLLSLKVWYSFPVAEGGPHIPTLSSRAQLVSRRFYSCCLLLFPGISQWTLSQGADEPAWSQSVPAWRGLSTTVVLRVNFGYVWPTWMQAFCWPVAMDEAPEHSASTRTDYDEKQCCLRTQTIKEDSWRTDENLF